MSKAKYKKPSMLLTLQWFCCKIINNRSENRSDIYSSIAQSVEHSAVNRVVVGSSPTGGASPTRHMV